jgi:hypothetical protein
MQQFSSDEAVVFPEFGLQPFEQRVQPTAPVSSGNHHYQGGQYALPQSMPSTWGLASTPDMMNATPSAFSPAGCPRGCAFPVQGDPSDASPTSASPAAATSGPCPSRPCPPAPANGRLAGHVGSDDTAITASQRACTENRASAWVSRPPWPISNNTVTATTMPRSSTSIVWLPRT